MFAVFLQGSYGMFLNLNFALSGLIGMFVGVPPCLYDSA